MSERLKDRVVLVTGGARGQGRAIAAKAAAEGAHVAICDLCEDIASVPFPLARESDLAETARLIEDAGRRCVTGVVDVREAADLREFVDRGVAELGRLDVVCANAGVASFGTLLDLSDQEWEDVIGVNLTGVWNTVRAAPPHLIERGEGSMILTSSINGREPAPELAHYVVSKHGVLGLMRQAAYELAPYGVRVNAIMPGPILSPMCDNEVSREWIVKRPDASREDVVAATRGWVALKGRAAMPTTVIADAMIWLASDESRHVTGIGIPVDAGHMLLPGMDESESSPAIFTDHDYEATALGPARTPIAEGG